MRKFFVFTALVAITCTTFAAEPAVFSGKPAIETAKVELFARTMAIAQANATAATTALNDSSKSPENASSTGEAINAIKEVLQLGSGIVDAENVACQQTGMSQADFHEVKIRLLQARMFQNMDSLKTALIGNKSGNEMADESLAQIDKKLADLEARLQKSRETLEKVKGEEAGYFAKQDSKIAAEKARIAKLQTELARETVAKKRESKQKQLNSARERLAKMETERQKPFKALINANERVAKDEKSVVVFRENMAAAI